MQANKITGRYKYPISDQELEEGLERTDAFVSLTNFDEENIMLALYANKMSHAKLITKINKTNFNCVIDEIPVGSVVSSTIS